MLSQMITLQVNNQQVTHTEAQWRCRIEVHKKSIYKSIRFIAETIEEGLEIQLKKIERENQCKH